MELTEIAKEKLVADDVKMKICLELGIAYVTFRRWLNSNSPKLTKSDVISCLAKHTELNPDQIIQMESVAYKSLSNN